MTDPVQLPQRRGREGSRWYNERPSPDDFASWFKTVKLHEGMDHDEWVSGITLIEATEKHDEVVGFGDDGRPQIVPDVQHQVYTPYPKAETRTAYFNALMDEHDDLTGFILPVPAPDPQGLPVGYFSMRVALPEAKGGTATMICYTARVLVIDGEVKWTKLKDADGVIRDYPTGKVVINGAHGTKSVPLLGRFGDLDPNAVMKAQTGAIGRALGFAGMLVIPGTGVATAEDMQESLSQGATPGAPDAPTGVVPPAPEEMGEDALRTAAAEMFTRLKNDHPEEFVSFQEWAKGRKLGKLAEIEGAPLKGLVRKLQRTLEDAVGSGEKAAEAPDLDISEGGS